MKEDVGMSKPKKHANKVGKGVHISKHNSNVSLCTFEKYFNRIMYY